MKILTPTVAFNSVLEITPEILEKMGVLGLILDIDNTLTTHDNPVPRDGVFEWLETMRENKISLIILSNNKSAERVRKFADIFELDFVRGKKPLTGGFYKAMEKISLEKSQVLAVGDQLFTDICGANFSGIKSAFVVPIEKEKTLFFRFKRFMEKPFLPKKYGVISDER